MAKHKPLKREAFQIAFLLDIAKGDRNRKELRTLPGVSQSRALRFLIGHAPDYPGAEEPESLVALGLVKRELDADGKSIVFNITPKGAKLAGELELILGRSQQ